MKKIIILFLVSCNYTMSAQPFQVGHTTITYTDSSRSNRSIQTEIYYPADIAGTNVPVTTATADRFPVLLFGHGFVMGWDAYQYLWEALCADGFIMAFPITETGLAPTHLELGKDLAFLAGAMKREGQTNTSLLFNRVDSASCVMGHSMGGGASFLSVPFDSSITAIANLSAAETNPSAIAAAASIDIPALIIAGGNDCVTPPPANQVPMYDSLRSNCKTYISINGGSHCQMADNNFFCNIGESTCTPQPAISRADQHTKILNYLIPWLRYQLKGDCAAGALFDASIIADTSIGYFKTCELCNTTLNEILSLNEIRIYPNPFSSHLTIDLKTTSSYAGEMNLFSIEGKLIHRYLIRPGELKPDLELTDLESGLYFLKISIDESTGVFKISKATR